MSYECDYINIVFGNASDICKFICTLVNSEDYQKLDSVPNCTQWGETYYATIKIKAPEGWEFQIWDELIPQFPALRFLLSRVSERDGYLNQVVRHRHEPYGFNCCLHDYTMPQAIGHYPVNSNPISILDDFLYEVLEDEGLCHAMKLLGYPKEALLECDISE
jgi:hypothetical protein